MIEALFYVRDDQSNILFLPKSAYIEINLIAVDKKK